MGRGAGWFLPEKTVVNIAPTIRACGRVLVQCQFPVLVTVLVTVMLMLMKAWFRRACAQQVRLALRTKHPAPGDGRTLHPEGQKVRRPEGQKARRTGGGRSPVSQSPELLFLFFDAIPDVKPVSTFAGTALELIRPRGLFNRLGGELIVVDDGLVDLRSGCLRGRRGRRIPVK